MSRVYTTYDKDLCLSLCKYITTSPMNIIELLPFVKQGILLEGTLVLRKIKKRVLGKVDNSTFPNVQKLPTGEIISWNEDFSLPILNEDIIIFNIECLFYQRPTKKNWTIYEIIKCFLPLHDKFLSENYVTAMKYLVDQALIHPKINPLLICTLSGDWELIQKYFMNVRSNKIEVWKFCHYNDIDFPNIIKKEVLSKIFLLRNISYINYDIFRYILLLEAF